MRGSHLRLRHTVTMRLRRNGAVPIYRQVRDAIAEQIDRGALAPGQRLPSEAQLASDFEINRLTVRRAIEELTREGIVFTRRGAGSYVTEARTRTPLEVSLSPVSEWGLLGKGAAKDLASGADYREVLLSYADYDGSDGAVRRDLEIPRAKISELETAFEVAGEIRMLSTLWMTRRIGLNIQRSWAERPGDARPGDYLALREEFGDKLYALWRSFSAEAASVHDAELFDIQPGSPLLVREGVTVDRFGTPVVRTRRRVRGDRVRYVVRYEPELDAAEPGSDAATAG